MVRIVLIAVVLALLTAGVLFLCTHGFSNSHAGVNATGAPAVAVAPATPAIAVPLVPPTAPLPQPAPPAAPSVPEGAVDRTADVSPDDPALVASIAEARRRLPEFLKAFNGRAEGQRFAVQKKFTENGEAEHLWVEITGIEGETLKGELASTPELIHSMKLGDRLTVQAKEVEDWVYSDGEKMVGDFSLKALKGEK